MKRVRYVPVLLPAAVALVPVVVEHVARVLAELEPALVAAVRLVLLGGRRARVLPREVPPQPVVVPRHVHVAVRAQQRARPARAHVRRLVLH